MAEITPLSDQRPSLIDAALLRVDGSKAGDARLALLAAEVPLEAETGSTAAGVAALLAALAGSADTIIIDLPRQLDAVTRGLLRTVDSVAIVSDFTLAGLRDTQRLVRLAAGLRAGARPLVIANRSGRDAVTAASSWRKEPAAALRGLAKTRPVSA